MIHLNFVSVVDNDECCYSCSEEKKKKNYYYSPASIQVLSLPIVVIHCEFLHCLLYDEVVVVVCAAAPWMVMNHCNKSEMSDCRCKHCPYCKEAYCFVLERSSRWFLIGVGCVGCVWPLVNI